MKATSPVRRGLRPVLIACVLLMLAVAWQLGVFARVGEPRALVAALVEMGALGQLAFIVAYTLLQPFGVPGTVFIVAAPLIWPWQTAFVLSMIGTMAASVVGFSFARFVARDWVSTLIPARLRKYQGLLDQSAFQTVVLLRLIFWMPQVLHSFFGISKVGFWTHFWGSLVGYVPPLLLVSYLGAEMFDATGKMQPTAWPVLAGLLVMSLVVTAIARVWERRRSLPSAITATPFGVSHDARSRKQSDSDHGRDGWHRQSCREHVCQAWRDADHRRSQPAEDRAGAP